MNGRRLRHLDRDIEDLKALVIRMGAMVEDSIGLSIRALLDRDVDLAQGVMAADDDIDKMEVASDQKAIELIAKMQPAAADLRFVAAVMKITPELERIADLAQDVCERAIELDREPALKATVDLPQLAADAQVMVRDALDAFTRRDVELARRVIAGDDAIDDLTEESFRELLTYMLEDPRNISLG